ncbi:MAG: tRNA 2-selenouridine(34) synthase MnmH [Betaproteobacteria bacterium]|nr:tRNA 2-selenouridine(34) synthase MnmH [Betaproteobacteria bacterium]
MHRVLLPLTAAQLAEWDAILDARSPAEFAEDHLPGARNCPVLDDAERALVGTAYKERGSFEAKRLGAPLVAANIARIISKAFADRPRHWRPLVYCWRGGSRSGSLTHVLRQVGWDAEQLEGGYKAFRRQVAADLEVIPARFAYRVVCGATGSGKSRLLEALAGTRAQVLDLEVLAAHRGSVLGELPGAPQPSQKAFETAIWSALSAFEPARPVFVESESRKVGNLRVPPALIDRMREGECLRLEAGPDVRADLLLEDYAHLVADPGLLREKLACLTPLHGKDRIDRWNALAGGGDWRSLVADLLESHYDPAYHRSMFHNYRGAASARVVEVPDGSRAAFLALAQAIAGDPAT